MTRAQTRSLFRYLGLAALVVILGEIAAPILAHAAGTPDMPTLSDIQAAAGAASQDGDTSRWIFKNLLGDFGDSPFSSIGQPSGTLLGGMFFIFNASIFAVGAGYILWTALTQIVVSANSGEVLGRQMSGVWLPVRIGTGSFGMLPVFGGFSLAQAVMMFAAILGIGMANMLNDVAIQNASSFSAIIPPPGLASPTKSKSIDMGIGAALFQSNVCALASAAYASRMSTGSLSGWSTSASQIRYDASTKSVITSGSPDCGSVKMNGDETRSGWSFGYRNDAVDYSKIAELTSKVRDIRGESLQALQNAIQPLAAAWFQAYQASTQYTSGRTPQGTGSLQYPAYELFNAVAQVSTDEQQKIKEEYRSNWSADSENQSLTRHAMSKMKDGGWMSLGSWYQTYAESNAALQSAAASSWFNITPPSLTERGQIAQALAAAGVAQATVEAGACPLSSLSTATGNCSAGQQLTAAIIESIAEGSGGTGMSNPVVTSKEIGDTVLDALGASWIASKVLPLIPGAGVAARGAIKLTSTLKSLMPSSDGGTLEKVGTYLITVFFFLGILLAVYIPFIPFICWFTALVAYFAAALEGLTAAQVWAFGHLHAEGEGMGAQTRQGYIYLLNLLLRPSLMVFGFFFASAICTLLGTFFIQQLPAALANVQGNSSTGPFIIFGVLCVTALILLGLVQGSFNLIHEIPDRVINWFGSHINSGSFARSMDASAGAQAQGIARWAGNGAAIAAAPKKPGGGGAAG